jgi:hypothetical protein
LPPKTDPPKQGPDNIVRMEADNIPAFQSEDFMPPENELEARVDFIYSEDCFEPDAAKYSEKSWEEAERLNQRKPMEQAVWQIVAPGDSQEVKLQKIYARVQQIRSTCYELRKTEQEEKRDEEKPPKMSRRCGSGATPTAHGLPGSIWPWREPRDLRLTGCGRRTAKTISSIPRSWAATSWTRMWCSVKLNGKDLYFDPGATGQ